ncbi:MAG TPA: M48 family metalloprotease [bacterium]
MPDAQPPLPQDPPEDAGAGRRYARVQYRLFWVELATGLAYCLALQASGASEALARWWEARMPHPALSLAGWLLVAGAGYALCLLPSTVIAGYVVPKRFGLLRLSLPAWIHRALKRAAFSWGIAFVMIEGFYAIVRTAGSAWPAMAATGWLSVSVLMLWAFPALILPRFYPTTPVREPEVLERLLGLCRRIGVPVVGVSRFALGVETRKANAMLAGLGRTRRVYVSDTLLEGFPLDEVEAVLAHEMGHHRLRHIPKFLALAAAGTGAGVALTALVAPWGVSRFGLRGLADPAGAPALALWMSALWLLMRPAQLAFSRRCEWQADRFALRHAAPAAFTSALERLGGLNLADPSPPAWARWLLYSHPPIRERISAARRGGLDTPAARLASTPSARGNPGGGSGVESGG